MVNFFNAFLYTKMSKLYTFHKNFEFFFNRINDNFENKKMRFQTKILFGEKTVSRGFG